MARQRRRRSNGDSDDYILLIILKEGALSLEQIEEKTIHRRMAFRSGQGNRRRPSEEQLSVAERCERLASNNLLKMGSDCKYQLTQEGKEEAEHAAETMERGAAMLQNQFLSPTAAARNTTIGYVFLATLKLIAGFLSGSVGLMADGADTTVDTAASAIVWFGIKFKKEILGTITILGLMFITAIILFYDSFQSIVQNIAGIFLPMTMPYVVIIVEAVAIVSMFTISLYQRFVGRRNQSLALISQSVDSKNSVYSSAAVIVGAIFAIFGIHWVDAVVGSFIAVRICIDGFGLSREVVRARRGEKPEFSKFKLPFEKSIRQARLENFRNWILYTLQQNKEGTKQTLVTSLEQTFRPSYMPQLFTEFTAGRNYDFDANFQEIIQPLLDDCLIAETEGHFTLTHAGKTYIKDTIDSLRYRETEL